MDTQTFLNAGNVSATTRAAVREAIAVIRRDRKWILAGFMVPMALCTLLSFVPSPKYEADSSLLVRFGREYVYNPETNDGVGNLQPMAFDRDQTLRAETAILGSRDVLEKAIKDVGLANIYPSIAKRTESKDLNRVQMAVIEMRKHLKMELVKDSALIHVSFSHSDPDISAKVVNGIVTNYLQRRREIFSTSQSAFLQEQVARFHQRLEQIDRSVEQFREKHGIVSFTPQMGLLLQQRNELESRHDEALRDVASNTMRVEVLTKNLSAAPSSVRLYNESDPGQAVDAARTRLLELQLRVQDLQNKYYDDNPLLQDARKQVANTENFIRQQDANPRVTVRTGRNEVRGALETDLFRARGDAGSAAMRAVTAQQQVDSLTQRIKDMSAVEFPIANLQREQQLVADGYVSYVRKLEDSRVADERNQKAQTNVSIVQSADRPLTRQNLQPLILGIGLVFSLLCALGVAFVVALFRQTYVLPESVERSLGLPVLADIPSM